MYCTFVSAGGGLVLREGEGAAEVLVDHAGHVASVVREHDAVGGHVLRSPAARRTADLVIVVLLTPSCNVKQLLETVQL